METKIICGDAHDFSFKTDLILTDPPFDMQGEELATILNRYETDHLVLITTMRQFLQFFAVGGWEFRFDFIIDGVVPKKSKSISQPNYTHSLGVYLTRPGIKSIFSRKLRNRSDIFAQTDYWPTIFHAPRHKMRELGQSKNEEAITDLLGSFAAKSVCDPFCGSGTILLAAFEVGIDCIAIEKNAEKVKKIKEKLAFLNL